MWFLTLPAWQWLIHSSERYFGEFNFTNLTKPTNPKSFTTCPQTLFIYNGHLTDLQRLSRKYFTVRWQKKFLISPLYPCNLECPPYRPSAAGVTCFGWLTISKYEVRKGFLKALEQWGLISYVVLGTQRQLCNESKSICQKMRDHVKDN